MSDEPKVVLAEARANPLYYVTGTAAFVKVPQLRGFWWKTDRSVMVSCPKCGSEEGVPCMNKNGYSSATHYKRRYKFRGRPY